MTLLMIAFFGLAAVAGIALAVMHFGKKGLPLWLAFCHGLVAVAGVIMLIMAVAKSSAFGVLGASLAAFALAAIGGLVLFLGFYINKKRLPSTIVVLHALIAVSGFGLLLWFTFAR